MNIQILLVAYVVAQLVNVIASTIKYILTIKASPFVAACANAMSYTISAVVTKLIVSQDMIAIIIITLVTNLLGVPIGKWLVNLFSKEKLWIYNATIKCTENDAASLRQEIKDSCLARSIYEEIVPDKMYSMRVFSYKREQSRAISKILKTHQAKYYIVEPM